MAKAAPDEQRTELREQRRKVDFDSYDVTVDELLRRLARGRIEIAPAYQRQFRWNEQRQSRLVESLLLGIPVPPLFMATNTTPDSGTSWEVVDGIQRLLSLANFLGDRETRLRARLEGDALRLTGLDKLSRLEGLSADELPLDIRAGLEDRPMKVTILNDKSDRQVRFDLFERLNTGGVVLTDHEVRECVYMGEFIDLVSNLSQSASFNAVVILPKASQKNGTPQDYVLRFFAFLERYTEFDHSVRDFLNSFCAAAATAPDLAQRQVTFERTFDFLAKVFPNGLRTRKGTTPVNLFEGISVGAALALAEEEDLRVPSDTSWVHSDEMRKLVTGATNDRNRVRGRIERARDGFLAGR